MRVFARGGYEHVAPSIIQPADIFLDRVGESIRSRTYIFTDPDGRFEWIEDQPAQEGSEATDLMVELGAANGVRTAALLTQMDVPLGRSAGNAVEVRESIDVAPPSMVDRPVRGWPMRYVPYNGGGVLPEWVLERPARPRERASRDRLLVSAHRCTRTPAQRPIPSRGVPTDPGC